MNIKELHTQNKPVSVSSLFKNNQCNVTAIQILKNEKLDEHTTKVPALLICVEGEVVFENKNGVKLTLISGDYIDIDPIIVHWVIGTKESQLLLIK